MAGRPITQELLKELYDYRDGYLYRKTKSGRKNVIGQRAVSYEPKGNRNTTAIDRKNYAYARLIFLWHHGWLPEIVDHIDRNSSNDKIENLRAADRRQNNSNRGSKIGSSSKYLGVSTCYNTWRARISINDKTKHIGNYTSETEAALAYNKAAIKYHGEFANLNIVRL